MLPSSSLDCWARAQGALCVTGNSRTWLEMARGPRQTALPPALPARPSVPISNRLSHLVARPACRLTTDAGAIGNVSAAC